MMVGSSLTVRSRRRYPSASGMMPGAFMDLDKRGERLRMIRIENQRVLQQSIEGRHVAIIMGIERLIEDVLRSSRSASRCSSALRCLRICFRRSPLLGFAIFSVALAS
jgi:hypothetical protein